MNDVYDDMALEQNAKTYFGLAVDVEHVILRNAPVSRSTFATVFLSNKKQLYLYVQSNSRLVLADVKKIVSRMGLVAELYLPPKGQVHYFDEVGEAKYREVFPGMKRPTPQDLHYYRTLAPYNPALIQISEVKDGAIKQFDADAIGEWRIAAKFTYRRIKAI